MSSLSSVLVALGSNMGDRLYHLERAIRELDRVMRVVRISSVYETEPVDSPPGSPNFFNVVVAGYTQRSPDDLLRGLLEIEKKLGRVRKGRNSPRTIDLDLIMHSANIVRNEELTLPHPRYADRVFVMDPIRELGLGWVDPSTRKRLDDPLAPPEMPHRRRRQPALSFREALLYFLTRAARS